MLSLSGLHLYHRMLDLIDCRAVVVGLLLIFSSTFCVRASLCAAVQIMFGLEVRPKRGSPPKRLAESAR